MLQKILFVRQILDRQNRKGAAILTFIWQKIDTSGAGCIKSLCAIKECVNISKNFIVENVKCTKAFVIFTLIFLAGCQTTSPNNTANNQQSAKDPKTNGVMIFFSEREPGSELFASRMFVSKKILYIDDDVTPNDFLLFDRESQTIYSVNSADKSVFVIKPKQITIDPPIEIDYQEESQPSAAIPKVSGVKATHFRYRANGKHCYDAVATEKEFLPDVSKALTEYRNVLAAEHATSVHRTPKDLLDACDLALNVFHASMHLRNGVPLREWDQKGFLKFMVNYRMDFDIKPEKLVIPEDYRQYSVNNQIPK